MRITEYLEKSPKDEGISQETLRTRRTILYTMDEWFQETLDTPIEEIGVKDAVRYFEDELKPRWHSDEPNEIVRDEQGQFKEIEKGGITSDTARIHVDALKSYLRMNLSMIEREDQEFSKWFGRMYDELPASDYSKKMASSNPLFFTKEEFTDLIEVAGKKYELIYKLMLDSGRRPKEVAMLKQDRIDFENNTIEYDILKKGEPVTEEVQISTGVVELLKRYIEHRVDENDRYVFATSSEQGFLTTSSIAQQLKEHAEDAGIELGDRSLKSFRHSHVTHRVATGESLSRIRRTGTHNTERVMETSYEGLSEEEMEKANTGLEAIQFSNETDVDVDRVEPDVLPHESNPGGDSSGSQTEEARELGLSEPIEPEPSEVIEKYGL